MAATIPLFYVVYQYWEKYLHLLTGSFMKILFNPLNKMGKMTLGETGKINLGKNMEIEKIRQNFQTGMVLLTNLKICFSE